MNKLGLYLHVPFCEKKCPYCDFYSVRGTDAAMGDYTECIIKRLKYEQERIGRPADTLYFGGGTPGLLGGARIARLVEQAKTCFGLENAEITAEVNPGDNLEGFLQGFASAGGNRLSIGLQSANDEELRLLGRRHTAAQAAGTVRAARRAGIRNLSLDLMLGIQGQDRESLRRSVSFCAAQGVEHVSAYLLKIEPRTAYNRRRDSLLLPDEDETCELYLLACEELERAGLREPPQSEILALRGISGARPGGAFLFEREALLLRAGPARVFGGRRTGGGRRSGDARGLPGGIRHAGAAIDGGLAGRRV